MNCYDVVGENDTKTEGTIRARFEAAASCSPCVLVLRNIDALGQTTQGSETSKGRWLPVNTKGPFQSAIVLRVCR
jgi:peroxin-6